MKIRELFRKTEFWLIVLFAVVLAVRLIMVFQTPYFNYDSYFDLRQADNIRHTGLPLYNDPLSYGGKIHLFAPLYYYVLGVLSLAFPLEILAKILPNLFASLLIFLIYSMALRLTKHQGISFFTAFFSAFIPVLFFNINSTAIDYLAALLVFGVIYCLFRISERKYIDYALILMFLLVLTSPLAFVLILGLLFYMILSKTENIEIEMKELELILFFTFLVFWLNLLIYKRAFLEHGILVIWQNMPLSVLSHNFSQLTFIESFVAISVIPLLLGLYAIYSALYVQKHKNVLMLTGFALAAFVLLWFKLISLITGLIFLSVTLVVLSAFSLKRLSLFIEKSKLNRQKFLFVIIILVLFIVTAIAPCFLFASNRMKISPTQDDVNALVWASRNIPENATIVSTIEEGNLVAYYANRKEVMDNDFLLVKNIDKRAADLDTIYTTRFETEAISDLNNYDATYIFFSAFASAKYKIPGIYYTTDENCFSEPYVSQNSVSKIYSSSCKISGNSG